MSLPARLPHRGKDGRDGWPNDPFRAALLALYREADEALAATTCEASTDCCHFGRTGREPYPTPLELREVAHAVAARGGARVLARHDGRNASPRRLPLVDDEGRCPLLSPEGRCSVYASRPFGCRTFFCDRAEGLPRDARPTLSRLGRRLCDLAATFTPRDPLPRPFTRALAELLAR